MDLTNNNNHDREAREFAARLEQQWRRRQLSVAVGEATARSTRNAHASAPDTVPMDDRALALIQQTYEERIMELEREKRMLRIAIDKLRNEQTEYDCVRCVVERNATAKYRTRFYVLLGGWVVVSMVAVALAAVLMAR